jgi:phosphoribosyl 1,2-cyclic phosphate phosphodiesterase
MEGRVVILGSGTSHGVPAIKCGCPVCCSADPRDFRLRTSCLIKLPDSVNILVDCGPDFRTQAIQNNIDHLDYVIFTHAHADHVHGIDDLKVYAKKNLLTLIMDERTWNEVRYVFDYMFGTEELLRKNNFNVQIITGDFTIGPLTFYPVPLHHGKLPVLGYRFGYFAYLTDVKKIPEESYRLIEGVQCLVIDALETGLHPTHFSYSEALAEIAKVMPAQAFFVHMTCNKSHVELGMIVEEWKSTHPELASVQIEPAYDGLEIPFLIP